MASHCSFVRRMPLLAAVVVGLLVLGGCSRDPASPAAKSAGAMRAGLLKQHDLKGRVAMIEFGLFDCELSGEGLDGMVLLHKLNVLPGLAFLRVEESNDALAVAAYYKDKDLKFPVHGDPTTDMAVAFKATSNPSFVLVDKFGRVRYRGRWPDNKDFGDWIAAMQAAPADLGSDAPMFGVVKLDGPTLLAATSLPGLDGQTIALEQAMGPEGMVAVFVDTTCPISGQALGDMPKVAITLAKAQINSIVVNIDGAPEVVKNYFSNKPLGAPVIYDATDATMDRWDIQSVPTVVYIAPDKTIAYKGVAAWAQVATAIEKARHLPPGTIRFSARGTSYG